MFTDNKIIVKDLGSEKSQEGILEPLGKGEGVLFIKHWNTRVAFEFIDRMKWRAFSLELLVVAVSI